MLGFAYTEGALNYLEALPPKLHRQVNRKARALQNDPYPPGCKKLNGVTAATGESVYRVRSGDYRILYVVRQNPNEVVVVDIDDRKDVYR